MSSASVEADSKANELIEPVAIPKVAPILEYMYGGLERVRLPSTLITGSAVLQGCLPLLMEEVPAETLVELLGMQKYIRLRELYRQSSLLNLWYSLELQTILESLTTAQIQVMLLKGADVATTLYPIAGLRHFGDIDLMVHPGDLAATIAVLERAGYHHHQEYRFEAISKQRAAFVYVKEVAAGYVAFEIHTAVHSNEMGISFKPTAIWERARTIHIDGKDVYGMGLEDLLLYLCWHFRSHAFDRLIWLYDIALLLQHHASELDWALIQRLAREQGLVTTVYYCVHWCEQIFQITLPACIQIEKFAPPAYLQRLIKRSVGDNLSALLVRKAERERKLLQRLMVDSVFVLYLVLLRTIFPSPTHLGRLYMEHSRLPVRLFWLYYPLHPLFLLKAYFSKRLRKKSTHV